MAFCTDKGAILTDCTLNLKEKGIKTWPDDQLCLLVYTRLGVVYSILAVLKKVVALDIETKK